MDDPEEALSGRAAHAGEHWSSKEISGRISEERPDLAVSDDSI